MPPALGSYDRDTALVVVDVQNDFADPRGSLYVTGGDAIIEQVNAEVAAARAAGAFIVYTQDWHPPRTPHFQTDGGVWPVHCVGGTWGAEFHPAVEVDGPVVRKGTDGGDGYSGFTVRDPNSGTTARTQLDAMLREHGCSHIVIAGLALDYCVKDTGFDALALGYPTQIIGAATRAVDLEPGDGERAVATLVAAGATIR